MNPQITYLLGAGASALSIPTVNGFSKDMENLCIELGLSHNQVEGNLSINLSDPKRPGSLLSANDVQQRFLRDLSWLFEACRNHYSIDTFAKKLFLSDRIEELNKLKFCTSAYLTIKQLMKKPDNRYDAFLASLLKKDHKDFPENVNVVSWNYDCQFELSYAQFSGSETISESQSLLRLYSKNETREIKGDGFGIVKINGTAGFWQEDGRGYIQPFFDKSITGEYNKNYLKEVLEVYARGVYSEYLEGSNRNRIKSSLSFAWEDLNGSIEKLITNLSNRLAKTECLIVIGYSFPYFNRDIDRRLLGMLPDNCKVYFQGLESFDILSSRFKIASNNSVPTKNMEKINDIDHFFIPPQL